jgi:List-Bact-rpt repeat protein
MRRRFTLIVTFAITALLMLGGATASQAAPGALRVLLVETQGASEFNSFITALKAKPGVAAVDDFNASTGTPSAAALAGYDLIVSTGDSDYQDATLYGDQLAGYLNAGGPVIQFAYDNWEETDAHPRGRFESGGYPPFIPGNNDNNDTTLAAPLVSNSPLLAGVTSFSTRLNTTDALASGATLLARYTDGRNAIATKGRVVSVTSSPGYDSDVPTTHIDPIESAAQLALNTGNVLGRHNVTVKKKGSGKGKVTSNAGIRCGKTCTVALVNGTGITLKAKPKKGSTFARWKGVEGCKKKRSCTFTPTGNSTIKAKFKQKP